jgi:hypothetical protein
MNASMSSSALIDDYLASARRLREGVAGLSPEQVKLRPVAGKWSTLEVVCHLADFEIMFADRIKRVIAEDRPALPSGDENLFAARLQYHQRDLENELALVDAIHRQVASILRTLAVDDFQRVGIHAEAGPLTMETLVGRAAGHIGHHLKFVAEKRRAMGM